MAIISLQEALDFLEVEAGYFNIKSINDGMCFTSDQGGPVTLDVPDGTYDGDGLATALQTALNADNTLTGTGTITFAVSYSSSTRKFTVDATAGHTIAYDHSESDGGLTFGFNADHAAAQTVTSDLAAGDPTSMVTEIRDGVEAWLKAHLRRTLESTAYTLEKYDGKGGKYLFLKDYPLTAFDRLVIGTLDAIKIRNTNTGTSASVSVSSTGLRLVLDGTLDATDVTFATNTTMTTMVAAVNAIGGGWEAAVLSSTYGSFKSSNLLERFGASAIDSNWVYLNMPDEAVDDFEIYPDEGTIYRLAGFPVGHNNVFVDFTAGYSSTTMPEDIKLYTRALIKFMYQRWREGAFGVDTLTFGDISTTFDKEPVPREIAAALGRYRRVRV